ncbi:thioredoxin domain-containing protein [Acinetobacter sp. CUI P1]|nr:thioredoxin domain-containing protein [Acinetobacter sp. CUI P1]
MQDLVTLDQQLVSEFSVSQTPTIMINNQVIGNSFDYNAITAAIEQELEK